MTRQAMGVEHAGMRLKDVAGGTARAQLRLQAASAARAAS
jgi:hypothetical protein